jgi:hypothetical protein
MNPIRRDEEGVGTGKSSLARRLMMVIAGEQERSGSGGY